MNARDGDRAAGEAEEKAHAQREADLVKNRFEELHEQPVKGDFDTAHLKAIHAYIFQDLPNHRPGIIREETEDWIKHRALEGRPIVYDVPYASKDIENKIADALQEFGGPDAIKELAPDAAAARFAELYGELDHVHGFYEGKPDLVIAFPGGRGTANMIRQARGAGVQVIEI